MYKILLFILTLCGLHSYGQDADLAWQAFNKWRSNPIVQA